MKSSKDNKVACVILLFILVAICCLSKVFHRMCVFLGMGTVSMMIFVDALAK